MWGQVGSVNEKTLKFTKKEQSTFEYRLRVTSSGQEIRESFLEEETWGGPDDVEEKDLVMSILGEEMKFWGTFTFGESIILGENVDTTTLLSGFPSSLIN